MTHDNDNMGEYGALLFQALKPPTADQVRKFMDGANREYAERVMKLKLPEEKPYSVRDASGGVQWVKP